MAIAIATIIVYGGFFGSFFYFSYLSWKTENGPKKPVASDEVHKVKEKDLND